MKEGKVIEQSFLDSRDFFINIAPLSVAIIQFLFPESGYTGLFRVWDNYSSEVLCRLNVRVYYQSFAHEQGRFIVSRAEMRQE